MYHDCYTVVCFVVFGWVSRLSRHRLKIPAMYALFLSYASLCLRSTRRPTPSDSPCAHVAGHSAWYARAQRFTYGVHANIKHCRRRAQEPRGRIAMFDHDICTRIRHKRRCSSRLRTTQERQMNQSERERGNQWSREKSGDRCTCATRQNTEPSTTPLPARTAATSNRSTRERVAWSWHALSASSSSCHRRGVAHTGTRCCGTLEAEESRNPKETVPASAPQ